MKLSPSIENRFTLRAKNVISKAENLASSSEVGADHLLLAILEYRGSLAYNILENHKLNIGDLNFKTPNIISLRDILKIAFEEAMKYGYRHIGTEHLLWGALKELKNKIKAEKYQLAVDIENHLKDVFYLSGQMNNQSRAVKNSLSAQTGRNILDKLIADVYQNIAEEGPERAQLENFGAELVTMAEQGKLDPVIGRENELQRIITVMSRRNKNNPILIGEPGVGKTALVYGLAQKIAEKKVPNALKNKNIFQIDLSAIVAGTTFRGEFEARLKDVLSEAEEKNAVIFIDEFHTVIGAGAAQGSLDAGNIIKPLLSLGKIQIIGATTLSEWQKYVEKDKGLERRFQPIIVKEPDEAETEKILFGMLTPLESHHKIKIAPETVRAAVTLSSQYITERFLPDKAIDLLDEACALKSLETELSGSKDRELRVADVAKALSLMTGIPSIILSKTTLPTGRQARTDSPSGVSKKLKQKIVGQDKAIETVVSALHRAYAGFASREKPLGSFLFIGPTGVGKTNLAKVLSDEILNSKMIKIDMSEFSEPHSISKLIGSPPGYVGYEEAGILTEKIRREPHSVVLFDEIEKAHPQVANVLLQILEEGVLTDNHGRKANFKNAVVILTSNLGSKEFNREAKKFGFAAGSKNIAETFDEIKENSLKSLRRHFVPELLSRLDEIVVFNPLGPKEIKQIAELEFQNLLSGNLAERRVEIKKAVAGFIAGKAIAHYNGAREIKHLITKLVINPLSEFILSARGKISPLRDGKNKPKKTIIVNVKNNKIYLT